MKAKNKQKMENMNIYLKTQGYCCQVCWVTLPVCNHKVMLVMWSCNADDGGVGNREDGRQSTCLVDRDDQQAKS